MINYSCVKLTLEKMEMEMKRKTRIIASLLVALMVIGEASFAVVALEGVPGAPGATEATPPTTESQENEAEPASPQPDQDGTNTEIPNEEAENDVPVAKAQKAPFTATATVVSPTVIKVEWTPVLGTGVTYTVTEASGLISERTFDAQATFAEFKGVKTGKTYTFNVVAKAEGVPDVTAVTQAVTVAPQPTKAANFYIYSSYKRIVLEWTKDLKATKYEIYRSRTKKGKFTKIGTATNKALVKGNKNKVMFTDKNVTVDKYYYYYVVAVGTKVGTEEYRAPKTTTKCIRSVQQMYLKVTFRYSKTLRAHDSSKKAHRFKKGQRITAYGYGSGTYRFTYNGRPYRVSYLRIKNPSSSYTRSFNYGTKEAEYFVNSSGQKSSTKYLIWVNLYTQHLYVFKGSKGNWKVYSHWEIASGKPSTPTPTGFNKKIFRKVRNKNGLGPWSCFQSWSAFHGKYSSWKLGRPASGGCIRNTMTKGKWIYRSIPMKTAVIIY